MDLEAVLHLFPTVVLGRSTVPDPEEALDKHLLNWIDCVQVPWFYDS